MHLLYSIETSLMEEILDATRAIPHLVEENGRASGVMQQLHGCMPGVKVQESAANVRKQMLACHHVRCVDMCTANISTNIACHLSINKIWSQACCPEGGNSPQCMASDRSVPEPYCAPARTDLTAARRFATD